MATVVRAGSSTTARRVAPPATGRHAATGIIALHGVMHPTGHHGPKDGQTELAALAARPPAGVVVTEAAAAGERQQCGRAPRTLWLPLKHGQHEAQELLQRQLAAMAGEALSDSGQTLTAGYAVQNLPHRPVTTAPHPAPPRPRTC